MHFARLAAILLSLTVLPFLVGLPAVFTQPPSPPPPDKYNVEIRYDITAPRDQHVALYKAMVEYLAKIGFDFQPPLMPFPNTDYEDPTKTTLTGNIAAGKALGC